MKKALILVVLLALSGALAIYQRMQPEPNSPRQSIDDRVARARRDKKLSAPQESFLRVQLAIVSFQVEHRRLPERLDELVPTYFEALPRNPETDKPFEYVREGNKYKLTGLTSVDLPQTGVQLAANVSGHCKPEDTNCISQGYLNPNEIGDDPFRYDPTGKRDPFMPFDFSAKPRNPGATTPLEQYDLGQLRLTAVLEDPTRGATGIVEDQAGKGFNVRIGTKMGLNSGVVVSIEKDRLKILETEKDLTGKETQRIVEVKIQAEPGGSKAVPVKKK